LFRKTQRTRLKRATAAARFILTLITYHISTSTLCQPLGPAICHHESIPHDTHDIATQIPRYIYIYIHTYIYIQIHILTSSRSIRDSLCHIFPRVRIQSNRRHSCPFYMAQSRPPPVRSHSAAISPPPLSPRVPADKNSDKRHTRRKSGSHVIVAEKRASSSTRPVPLSRKSTSYSIPKAMKTVASKDREYDGERDSGESFPQFWCVPLLFFFSLLRHRIACQMMSNPSSWRSWDCIKVWGACFRGAETDEL